MERRVLVAPTPGLVVARGVLDKQFELSEGVTIGPMPTWARHSKDPLPFPQRDSLDCSLAFRLDYEPGQDSVHRAQELVAKASVALWIAGDFPVGPSVYVHFDRTNIDTVSSGEPIILSKVDDALEIEDRHLRLWKEFHAAMLSEEGLQVPVLMLYRGLIDRWLQTRYLCFWIVLESLFGPKDPGETTYRIAARLAKFLKRGTPDEALSLQRRVKSLYGWRSKIVHGHRVGSLSASTAD